MSTDSPASPCIRNCCLNDQDQCLGCGRLLAEILVWGNASVADRWDIVANATRRQKLLTEQRNRVAGPE